MKKLQQSNYQALIVTRNGCVHSISTVVHDNQGNGIANSHGYTMHFDYNDFYDDGYAIDTNGDPTSEYVDFAFLNDGHVFDKIEKVLGKASAVKVVFNVFQMTDWQEMMDIYPLKEQLLGIFNTIVRSTASDLLMQSQEKEHSILSHAISFHYR
jgi:hypothetical protein